VIAQRIFAPILLQQLLVVLRRGFGKELAEKFVSDDAR